LLCPEYPLEGAKRIRVHAQKRRADQIGACKGDRGKGGRGDIPLSHQDFTGEQMHRATAEKIKKKIKKTV